MSAFGQKMMRRLVAVGLMFWRRQSKLTLLYHARNEIILELVGVSLLIAAQVLMKKLLWCGHMWHMDEERFPTIVWKWEQSHWRSQGGLQRKWNTEIDQAMQDQRTEYQMLQKRAAWTMGCGKRLLQNFLNICIYLKSIQFAPHCDNLLLKCTCFCNSGSPVPVVNSVFLTANGRMCFQCLSILCKL